MGVSSKGSAARVLGRYVLHGELASGGMATVHLGRLKGEAGFARTVAIKRLHAQYAKDPEFVAMFVDEARLAARIRHPNVVPTLDVISEGTSALGGATAAERGDEIFLVMEYVPGESLSRLLRALQKKKRLVPPHVATSLLAGVLHGLHAAHEAKSEKGQPLGIVHRDVSPQNVLVGVDGIAHVLDFGVAKATGRLQTTREGAIKGKLAYMAPEQLESGTLTRQSDVYAAAVVLWETLTLTRLFEAESEPALLMKVVAGKIAPPSTVVPGLSTELDEIVLRGLARDPASRWATARDFAMALEKCGHAPASEIGEWVQSIAGDELAHRARMVAEIERGSTSVVAAMPVDPGVQEAQEAQEARGSDFRFGDVNSQVSAISLSRSEQSGPMAPRARGGKAYFFAGGLAGLLFVIVAIAFIRAPARSHAAGAPSPPTAMTLPARSATPVAPANGTAATEAAPVPAPPDTTTIEFKPSPPRPAAGWAPEPKPVSAAPVAPPPPAPATAPASRPAKSHPDCDPPFTRDAQGHKHYKLQCL